LIEADFSRATGRPIGRFQAQSFRNFLLPFRRAERAASFARSDEVIPALSRRRRD
jgi:hypothetical protein